jgi:hypothetical protein
MIAMLRRAARNVGKYGHDASSDFPWKELDFLSKQSRNIVETVSHEVSVL